MKDTIYFEVDKSNQEILSYSLDLPDNPSSKSDYIEATMTELTVLNALEDFVFAPGAVATLADLQGHRERVKAQQAKTNPPFSVGVKQPPQGDGKATNATPKATPRRTSDSLVSQIKSFRSTKKAKNNNE